MYGFNYLAVKIFRVWFVLQHYKFPIWAHYLPPAFILKGCSSMSVLCFKFDLLFLDAAVKTYKSELDNV